MFRVLLAAFVLLLVLPQADAQRGGRSAPKRSNSKASKTRQSREPSDFVSRLWYGAGGTAGFASNGASSQFTIGLIPQVGYKFNEWLSAGPRIGATYTGVKGATDRGTRDRVNLWNFTGSSFVRARISMFYIQPEVGIESQNSYFIDNRGRIATDVNLEPATARENETVLLIGAGYNGSIGGMGSDIGIFYNLFDDVNSLNSPISFRIMLTFNY